MRQRILSIFLFVWVLFIGSFGSRIAAASKMPVEAIKELDRMADQYRVGRGLTLADKLFNRQLKKKMLSGAFDLEELASLALAEHWKLLSSHERSRFVKLLTHLLEERSVFAKETAESKGGAKSYQISYQSDTFQNKEKTKTLVRTVIHLPKRKMKLDLHYKLKKVNNDWKIFDVIMDGASLVANYKYSFGAIIKKNGYPELIRRMEEKLKEFQSERKKS